MTLSITTLSIMTLYANAKCYYAEYLLFSKCVKNKSIVLNVVMLSVVMLSVVVLNVVAPLVLPSNVKPGLKASQ